MNKVILSGRICKDVTNTNGAVKFTVATDRRFKSEGQPTADFISCVAFGKTGEFIDKYFSKGSGIELEGRIQTGSYTNKDGNRVYTTDVIVDNVEFPKGASKSNSETTKESNNDQSFMDIPDNLESELPFN